MLRHGIILFLLLAVVPAVTAFDIGETCTDRGMYACSDQNEILRCTCVDSQGNAVSCDVASSQTWHFGQPISACPVDEACPQEYIETPQQEAPICKDKAIVLSDECTGTRVAIAENQQVAYCSPSNIWELSSEATGSGLLFFTAEQCAGIYSRSFLQADRLAAKQITIYNPQTRAAQTQTRTEFYCVPGEPPTTSETADGTDESTGDAQQETQQSTQTRQSASTQDEELTPREPGTEGVKYRENRYDEQETGETCLWRDDVACSNIYEACECDEGTWRCQTCPDAQPICSEFIWGADGCGDYYFTCDTSNDCPANPPHVCQEGRCVPGSAQQQAATCGSPSRSTACGPVYEDGKLVQMNYCFESGGLSYNPVIPFNSWHAALGIELRDGRADMLQFVSDNIRQGDESPVLNSRDFRVHRDLNDVYDDLTGEDITYTFANAPVRETTYNGEQAFVTISVCPLTASQQTGDTQTGTGPGTTGTDGTGTGPDGTVAPPDREAPDRTDPLECGWHGKNGENYLVLCYLNDYRYPREPIDDVRATKDYVTSAFSRSAVREGFYVAGYHNTPDRKDIALRRVDIEQSITETIAQGIKTDTVAAGFAVQYEPLDNKVVVVADGDLSSLPGAMQSIVTEASTHTTAEGRPSVNAKRTRIWCDRKAELDEDVRALTEAIEEQKGVRVEVLRTTEQWPRGDQDEQRLIQYISTIQLCNSDDRDRYGNTLPACTAFILSDQSGTTIRQTALIGTEIYQTSYCGLTVPGYVTRDATIENQELRILEAALEHTEAVDAQQLLEAALDLSSRERTLREETEQLIQYIEEKYATGAEKEKVLASTAIIKTRKEFTEQGLREGAVEETLENIGKQVPKAYPKIAEAGAILSLDIANQHGRCDLIRQVLPEYEGMLQGGEQIRLARQKIADCQFQEARQTCQPLDVPGTTQNILATDIVFINDAAADFERRAQTIADRVMEIPNLDDYRDEVAFHQVESLGPITSTNGPLQLPSIDTQLLQRTMEACGGHMFIVLSGTEYVPTVQPRNGGKPVGFVSMGTCRTNERCQSIYTARAIGLGLFKLAPEADTATAPITFSEETSTLRERFSAVQESAITRYFTGVSG